MQGGGGQHDRHGGLRFPVVPTIGPIRNDRSGTIKGQLLRLKWGQSRKERAMHLQLDENGPLHSQLTRALKTAMRSGLVGGSRLPATRQLANELGISRNTVLAAYEQLRAEGFIDGRVGSGSYIAEQLPQTPRSPAPPQASVAPQSAFARRMRADHQPRSIPGRVADGVGHAPQIGRPRHNPRMARVWEGAHPPPSPTTTNHT